MCAMTHSLPPTMRWAMSGSACLRPALSSGASVLGLAVAISDVIHPVSDCATTC